MDVKKLFKNSAEGYNPAVMWFTCGPMDQKEMTYQLEGFCKQGLRDFFIHPVNGSVGDYLGEYFFRMVRHARDEAKRLGMKYWIYDEYNWSSGVAAGQVLRDAPWAHGSCLFRIEKTVDAGAVVRIEMPKKEKYNTKLLLATENGVAFSPLVEGDTVVYENTTDAPITVEIFVSKWDLGTIAALRGSEVVVPGMQGYLDTLDPEAVDEFIRSTHEKYKAEIGEDFGNVVKGVFCDEVITYFDFRESGEEDAKTLPWSRRFAERFAKRCGYDIIPRLSDLMKGEDKKLLIDYWESVADFMMEGFAGRTYDWCNKNGLIATGHIDAEESILSQVYRSGDNYEFYKRFGMPGIDSILTYFRLNDHSFAIAPKIASSAAHFLHKERILCETFTISGWEIGLSDMKRAINKLALLGINFIQYMGARFDFILSANAIAMTNNFQNPLFQHYGALSEYVSSLQAFVAKTEYDAHLLLFYPMTTARAMISYRTVQDEWDCDLNMTLRALTNSLLSLQIPFEIGFEQVINEAEVKDGRFIIDGQYYDTLILPETEYIKEETFRKISAFANGGGKLISVNGKPLKIVSATIKTAPKIPMLSYECRDYEYEGENHPSWEQGQPFDGVQKAPMAAFTQAIRTALGEIQGYPISLDPKDGIYSAFRKDADGYYVLVANDNGESTEVSGRLIGVSTVALIDTATAEYRPIKIENGRFSFSLEASESAILVLGESAKVSVTAYEQVREVPLGDVRFSIVGDNFAHPLMHHIRGSLAERIAKAHDAADAALVCALADEITQENAVLCRASKNIYIPVKGERDYFGWSAVDGKGVKAGETVVCTYDFCLEAPLSKLQITCDPEWNTAYYLNGERLTVSNTERVWHFKNPIYDITSVAKVGSNRLVAICRLPNVATRPYPLPAPVLKGNFRIFEDHVLTSREGENGFGLWNGKGYACFGGDGVYETSFAYAGEGDLVLSLDTSDTVQIFVNGVRADLKFAPPYRVNITKYAKKGDNALTLCVTSTLSNFIYKSSPSGLVSAHLTLQK